MLSPECRPAPPAIPHFSRDMEKSLVAAARASSPRRQARAPRLVRLAAASLAAAAVAVAAGVGIDHAVSNRPAAAIGPGSAERPVHIHAVAFSVDTTAGGTVTVTLMRDHVPDPGALRHALAEAGVPALVTAGSVCYVPGPSALAHAFSPPRHLADGSTVITITRAAIPAGSKLSIGYFRVPGGGGIHVSIVPGKGPLTCTSTPPARPGG